MTSLEYHVGLKNYIVDILSHMPRSSILHYVDGQVTTALIGVEGEKPYIEVTVVPFFTIEKSDQQCYFSVESILQVHFIGDAEQTIYSYLTPDKQFPIEVEFFRRISSLNGVTDLKSQRGFKNSTLPNLIEYVWRVPNLSP
jgi:hypothetical protein